MIIYVSADLVASTSSDWTPDRLAGALETLRQNTERIPDCELDFGQGDSFQLQAPAAYGWMVALACYWHMRASANTGARVAFAVGAPDDVGGRALGLRDGSVYRRAGRGVEALRERDQRFGFFPDPDDGRQVGWEVASEYANAVLVNTTQRQCELLAHAFQPGDIRSGEQVAAHFGLSPSTVSQHLKAGMASLHLRSLQRFSRTFADSLVS